MSDQKFTKTIVRVSQFSIDDCFTGRIVGGPRDMEAVMGRRSEITPVGGKGWEGCYYAAPAVLDRNDKARASLMQSITGQLSNITVR
jgi:hypothetical protein